jgi:4-hydroxybenzoate polyprenyltransferase
MDWRGVYFILISLFKPQRTLVSCTAFFVAMVFADRLELSSLFLGWSAIILAYSSQSVYNDIIDLDSDRINAPDRVLVRGILDMRSAYLLMFLLLTLSLICAYVVSINLFLIGILALIMGLAYNRFTKRNGFLSYPTLALTHICLPFLAGYATVAGFDDRVFVALLFLFMSNWLAISIKDFKDVAGDVKQGVKSFPVIFGEKKAAMLTSLGFMMPLFLVWIPVYYLQPPIWFILPFLVVGIWKLCTIPGLIENPFLNGGRALKGFRLMLIIELLAWVS